MHKGQYPLAEGGTATVVVGMKDCINETRAMNSKNTIVGGWDACEMRTWLNSDTGFKGAVPATLLPIFKPMKIVTAMGGDAPTADSTDTFALFAEKEVFGENTNANSTAESTLFQIEWYKTAGNRAKKTNSSSNYWWERSPAPRSSGMFCVVAPSGTSTASSAIATNGISPFGCI